MKAGEAKVDVRMVAVADVEVGKQMRRKVTEKSPGIAGLAASIKAMDGILEPVIVRPMDGRYELLAGCRRLIATKVAGLPEIKAEIIDADDATARLIFVTENLQREDLTPLEEATVLEMVLNDGKNKSEVAAQLGRPLSWVVRRARLIALTPEWRQALQGKRPSKIVEKLHEFDAEAFVEWSVAHMELVARYPAEVQNDLLTEMIAQPWMSEWTVSQLEKELAKRTQLLKRAPWKLDDETLVPEAGGCVTCLKRSSRTPGLFDDDFTPEKVAANDKCLDGKCWVRKAEAYVDRRIASLRKKYPDLRMISLDWYTDRKADVLGAGGYDDVKKNTPGACPAVVVSPRGRGQFKWIKPRVTGRTTSAGRQRDTNGKLVPLSKAERYEKLANRRSAHVVDAIRRILNSGGKQNHPNFVKSLKPGRRMAAMVALAATFGVDKYSRYSADRESWQKFRKLMESPDRDAIKALWKGMHGIFATRLTGHDVASTAGKIREACEVCKILCVDFAALEKAAEEAIPVPKAWAKYDAAEEAGLALTQKTKKKGKANGN